MLSLCFSFFPRFVGLLHKAGIAAPIDTSELGTGSCFAVSAVIIFATRVTSCMCSVTLSLVPVCMSTTAALCEQFALGTILITMIEELVVC
jgi:hypothetical protein